MAIALSSAIQNLIQTDLLRREMNEALMPVQLFRGLATRRERWEARLGQEEIITRNGLMPVSAKAKAAGVDPTPQSKRPQEQWRVVASPYNDTIDTHMPSSYTMIQNEFLRDAKGLIIQAGQTINHVVRNKVYTAYTGGNTRATAAGAAVTALPVAHLAGFREHMVAGRMTNVGGGAAALNVTVAGVANTVIAATPDDPDFPDGPGTLTLGAAATWADNDPVLAENRSRVIRAGGASTILGIAASHKLTFALVRQGVARLRSMNVPTFADGTYHMHLNPTSEGQLFEDTEFQSIVQGASMSDPWLKMFAAGVAMGVTFIRNNETPGVLNTSVDDYVPFDTVVPEGANQDVEIHRPILLGDTAIMEKYLPVDAFIAPLVGTPGATVGSVPIGLVDGASGALGVMDGIRYIIRGPQNRLQDTVAQTWAFEGDWGIPTDSMTGTPDMYKRAIVFEHA